MPGDQAGRDGPGDVTHRWGVGRVIGLYTLFGVAWVMVGSVVASTMVTESPLSTHTLYELTKGLLFVGVSAALLKYLLSSSRRHVAAAARDASAARAEAHAHARLSRDLFDTLPEPAWVYDLNTLRFLTVNDAACRRYGYTPQAFTGLTLRDIRPSGESPRPGAAGGGVRASGSDLPDTRSDAGVFQHRASDGRVFPVRVRSVGLNYAGTPAEMVVAWDVSEIEAARAAQETANTELGRLNIALAALNDDLERRVEQRTASLQRISAELEWFGMAVSQDLHAPLVHLRRMASSLAASASERLTPAEVETAHRLVGSAARTSHLLDQLLHLARTGGPANDAAPRPEAPVSLILLLSELVGQLDRESPLASRRVALVEPLYWTPAPRVLLSRVLLELLRTTAGEDGAQLSVTARLDAARVLLTFGFQPAAVTPERRARLEGLATGTASSDPTTALLARSLTSIDAVFAMLAPNRLTLSLPFSEPV